MAMHKCLTHFMTAFNQGLHFAWQYRNIAMPWSSLYASTA